jgi:uncharacterized protein YegP (UPF0339 family)
MTEPMFVIRKNSAGQFYFYLRAENSEIIAISEFYTTKASAENGIASVKKNAETARTVDMTTDDPSERP